MCFLFHIFILIFEGPTDSALQGLLTAVCVWHQHKWMLLSTQNSGKTYEDVHVWCIYKIVLFTLSSKSIACPVLLPERQSLYIPVDMGPTSENTTTLIWTMEGLRTIEFFFSTVFAVFSTQYHLFSTPTPKLVSTPPNISLPTLFYPDWSMFFSLPLHASFRAVWTLSATGPYQPTRLPTLPASPPPAPPPHPHPAPPGPPPHPPPGPILLSIPPPARHH